MTVELHKLPMLVVFGLICTIALARTVHAGYGFYVVDSSVRTGMIVSLTDNPGVVEPAKTSAGSKLVGVVGTSLNDLDVQPGQIAVQTDGVVSTLVSTLEGDIKVGDQISVSSAVGVGSRNVKGGWIIGIAQSSLNKDTTGAVKTTLVNAEGKNSEVYVGNIPVLIKVVYFNPSETSKNQTESSNVVPPKVQQVADSIAGKRASLLAVILASLLLIIGFIFSGYIINGTVRNGIQSLSRQPLARKSILGGMTRTLLLALILMTASVVGSLILIRLL